MIATTARSECPAVETGRRDLATLLMEQWQLDDDEEEGGDGVDEGEEEDN